MVQQTRHRQIVAPRVIHKVHERVGNQGACESMFGLWEELQDHAASSYLFARVMIYNTLYVQAAHCSNVSASICLAQVNDAKGDTRSALKYWAKAAKLGHPEAQFRLGRVRLATVISSCSCFSACASACLHKDFSNIFIDWVIPVSTCTQNLHSHRVTSRRCI